MQETNAIVIADVSGSHEWKTMATSIGLAIYLQSELPHNLFMTFSQKPEFVSLRNLAAEKSNASSVRNGDEY